MAELGIPEHGKRNQTETGSGHPELGRRSRASPNNAKAEEANDVAKLGLSENARQSRAFPSSARAEETNDLAESEFPEHGQRNRGFARNARAKAVTWMCLQGVGTVRDGVKIRGASLLPALLNRIV